MALAKITKITGKGVYVPGDDMDTDRIIPARFMKCITFDGLGEYLFYDVRKNEDGSDKEHPLNDKRFSEASILLTGTNFGCGSSREHAPQSLYRYGFRAIIAISYAEIFYGNSIKLGMPCFTASREKISKIATTIENNPDVEINIDVENAQLSYGNEIVELEINKESGKSLADGKWDPIAELLESMDDIDRTANKLIYVN